MKRKSRYGPSPSEFSNEPKPWDDKDFENFFIFMAGAVLFLVVTFVLYYIMR